MSRLTIIARAVAAETGISVGDMLSKRGKFHIVRARHMAWLLGQEITPASMRQIGMAFGGKDHTTVIHGIKRAEQMRREDPLFAQQFESAKQIAEAAIAAPCVPVPLESIINGLVEKYVAKIKRSANANPKRFLERFGNQVTP